MNKIIIITGTKGYETTSIFRELKDKNFLGTIPLKLSTTASNKENMNDFLYCPKEDFLNWLPGNKFIAWEEESGIYTGLLTSEINDLWENSFVPVVETSVYLAEKIASFYRDESIVVFIEPPSLDIFQERLTSRKISEEEIKSLLQKYEDDKFSFLRKSPGFILLNKGPLEKVIVEVRKAIFNVLKSTIAT